MSWNRFVLCTIDPARPLKWLVNQSASCAVDFIPNLKKAYHVITCLCTPSRPQDQYEINNYEE